MPCYDPGPTPSEIELSRKSALLEKKRIQEKLDVLTRYLCESLTFIDDHDLIKETSDRLQRWFAKHKVDDKKRITAQIQGLLDNEDFATFQRLFKAV